MTQVQKQPPFYKKGCPKSFGKFTEEYFCETLLFDKVAGLRPATLLKK